MHDASDSVIERFGLAVADGSRAYDDYFDVVRGVIEDDYP